MGCHAASGGGSSRARSIPRTSPCATSAGPCLRPGRRGASARPHTDGSIGPRPGQFAWSLLWAVRGCTWQLQGIVLPRWLWAACGAASRDIDARQQRLRGVPRRPGQAGLGWDTSAAWLSCLDCANITCLRHSEITGSGLMDMSRFCFDIRLLQQHTCQYTTEPPLS